MSMNVFADLDFADPELELAKARIVNTLQDLMEDRHIAEQEAARTLNVSSPNLHELLRGQWGDYSIECLIKYVHAFDVSIRFDPDTGRIIEEAAAPLALTA